MRAIVGALLVARALAAQSTDPAASAFKDSTARAVLFRARAARLAADSALSGYDAQSHQRVALSYGLAAVGRDRMLFGYETIGRVRWRRGRGAAVEIQGIRTYGLTSDLTPPIPYYPGLEALWTKAGPLEEVIKPLVLQHPLIAGAETYYTYENGDGVTIRTADGTIRVRELRVRPRSPKPELVVGSFWFDDATGQLVRAAYRPSAPLDMWVALRQSSDSAARAGASGPTAWLAKFLTNPARIRISAIAIDYGLYEGRFWLPRARAATLSGQAGVLTGSIRVEQRFTYSAVDTRDTIPMVVVRADSVNRDSLSGREKYDAVSGLRPDHRDECSFGDRYTVTSMRDGVPVAMSVPCDRAALRSSAELPPSIFAPATDAVSKERDALAAAALGLDAQSPFSLSALPRPSFRYGLAWTRFNRVEGLSLGAELDQPLGGGYAARALGRLGTGDRWLNAEFGLLRSNVTDSIELRAFRRLTASNDWGQPLGFSSSLAAGFFGRDNGFYYRSSGVELLGGREATFARGVHSAWRVFAERQDSASMTMSRGLGGRFVENIVAERGNWFGSSLRLTRTSDLDPRHFRLLTDIRMEVAFGTSHYTRGSFDVTASWPMGRMSSALTIASGTTTGNLPVQRRWFLGGANTIRGQAPDTGQSGNEFWLARAELNPGFIVVNRIFADFGWTGDRSWNGAFKRPMGGAGVGWSLYDGLVRLDIARGIFPRDGWRTEFYLNARY